ncbi:uncharacterized protein METZ01_LOCUS456056 [marine metagenome]|uniref:Uncharacterized protein n=1 Tax=marine metagenome TaxID=408172 RepID=A0A383A5X5_9ZZZZ
MASFKFNGMIPDDDPRYQEGMTIMIGLGLNEKSRTKSKKTKEKMTPIEASLVAQGLSLKEAREWLSET